MYTGIQIQARNQNTGVHCAKGGKNRQRLDRPVMDTPHAGIHCTGTVYTKAICSSGLKMHLSVFSCNAGIHFRVYMKQQTSSQHVIWHVGEPKTVFP